MVNDGTATVSNCVDSVTLLLTNNGELWLLWWRLGLTSDPLVVPLTEARYVLLGLVGVSWLDVEATGVVACVCFLYALLLEALLLLVANWDGGLDSCWMVGDLVVSSDFSVVAKLNACDEGEAVDEGAERFLLFLVFGVFSLPSCDLSVMRN